jgi:hypothetical protein
MTKWGPNNHEFKFNSEQMIMYVNKCILLRDFYPFKNSEWFLKISIHEMGEA